MACVSSEVQHWSMSLGLVYALCSFVLCLNEVMHQPNAGAMEARWGTPDSGQTAGCSRRVPREVKTWDATTRPTLGSHWAHVKANSMVHQDFPRQELFSQRMQTANRTHTHTLTLSRASKCWSIKTSNGPEQNMQASCKSCDVKCCSSIDWALPLQLTAHAVLSAPTRTSVYPAIVMTSPYIQCSSL